MNEFFLWNMTHEKPWNATPRLTDAEQSELFDLMADPAIPEHAMSIEMADGYLTACIVGPMPVPVHQWMEAIFGQPALPLPHDSQRQQRLLELLLRRSRDIDVSTALGLGETTADTIFMPLTAQVPPQERITPYQLDEYGQRLGEWDLRWWADGFRQAVAEDDAWAPLVTNRDMSALLGPVVLYSLGHNPDDLERQIDEDNALFASLICSFGSIRRWWSAYRRGEVLIASSYVREGPKVGRNDPCPCGSGKKYKKCCGA